MKSTIWPSVAMLLFSCVGSDEPAPGLDGLWVIESNSLECALSLYLDGGDYELSTFCELQNGEFVSDVEAGSFTEDGSRITFQPVWSSCADSRAYPQTLQYQFLDGGLLRLVAPDGVLIFERLDGAPTQGRVTFGCFDDSGKFTPMPVGIIGQ